MRQIFKIGVYSNIHIAVIGFLLSLESNCILEIEDIISPLFVFFSTLFIYNLGYYKTILFNAQAQRPAALWMKTHVAYWAFSMIIALIGITYTFAYYSLVSQVVVLFLSAISLLYIIHGINILGINLSIRNIPLLKTFIVSAIWALITLIPQVIDLHLFSIDHHWPMLLLERFFFILPITLVFDIRDIQSDPESLLTLPKLIGAKGTKFLAAISLFIGYYFLLHLNLSKEIIISMAVLYMLMFLSILYANEKRDELYFSGYMDALMGVHALVILFFYWI